MEFEKITLKEAENILSTDSTFRKDVYFVVGDRAKLRYNTTKEEIGTCVRVDRGQVYSLAQFIGEIAPYCLFGGIYTRKEV